MNPDNLDDLDDAPAPEPRVREDDAPAQSRPIRPRPSKEPPHSAEAEEHILGACLLDAAVVEQCNLAGITAASFHDPRNRAIFDAALTLGPNLSLITLVEHLGPTALQSVGGIQRLMEIERGTPTTAHASYFIEKVREKAILRDAIKAHQQAIEDAYGFTGGLDEFLQISVARVAAATGAPAQARREQQLKTLHARRVQATTKPPEPVTRLFLADKPVATPGNLVTLISRAKTGKTAALGAATAAMIAATTSTLDRDTFKFRASNPEGQAVIVIDTEQSPYDAWQCYERTLKRAGGSIDPPWLHHFALVGYTVPELHAALDLALDECSRLHGGIFAVILDGVADFVASVNDEAECNGIVTWLRARSVSHNCPVICVIHSNEAEKSGDDGRGHLGKQLIRKAESNLLLKKSGDVTLITSDKQRKAPITPQDGVAFRWDDTAQMHVSCSPDGDDGEPTTKAGRPHAYHFSDFASIFPKADQPAMTRAQLFRFASDFSPIKETAFRDLLARAVQDGELVRLPDGLGFKYRLAR